jgi:hypothetical protein
MLHTLQDEGQYPIILFEEIETEMELVARGKLNTRPLQGDSIRYKNGTYEILSRRAGSGEIPGSIIHYNVRKTEGVRVGELH